MSNRWLWPTIGLVLLAFAPIDAETVYSDGWVPPRLVDGVWVSSGVSDEVAKAEAARVEQEKLAEQARWQQWYSPALPPDWSDEWMFSDPNAWWTEPSRGGQWGQGLLEGQWVMPGQPPIVPGAWMFNGPGLTATNPFYENWFNWFYPVGPGVEGFVPSRLGPAIMPDDYPTLGW